jgi:hypothetical protein
VDYFISSLGFLYEYVLFLFSYQKFYILLKTMNMIMIINKVYIHILIGYIMEEKRGFSVPFMIYCVNFFLGKKKSDNNNVKHTIQHDIKSSML